MSVVEEARYVASQREALLGALAEVVPDAVDYYQSVVDAGTARGYTPVQAMAELGLLPVVEAATWARLGIEVVQPGFDDVDLSAFARWPAEAARSHLAVPVVGGRVAAPDPAGPALEALVRAHLGPRFRLVAAPDAEALASLVDWALDRLAARGLADAAQQATALVPADLAAAPAIEEEDASASEVAALVEDILRRAVERSASDVHLEPGRDRLAVRYRVDGILTGEDLPRELGPAVVSRLKVMGRVDIAQSRRPADGRFSFPVGGRAVDCRLVTLPSVWGESATVRLLDRSTSAIALSGTGLADATVSAVRAMVASPVGALFVTGPTGSGKTTTLYALLAEVARPERKVLTIEDPVEYRVDGVSQHQVDHLAGFTFATALRSFLRADPDVIMVGEVRDTETAAMAVDAAYTGHLVLTSFHASSAAVAPLRLVEMGIAPALVGAGISGVLAQRLVRRLCPACRVPDEAHYEAGWPVPAPERIWAANPAGCQRCLTSGGKGGYKGRVAVGELLVVDEEARRAIVSGAGPDAIRAVMAAQGARTMWEDGLAKVAAGATSMAELARVAKEDE